jgi:hypothetical protein
MVFFSVLLVLLSWSLCVLNSFGVSSSQVILISKAEEKPNNAREEKKCPFKGTGERTKKNEEAFQDLLFEKGNLVEQEEAVEEKEPHLFYILLILCFCVLRSLSLLLNVSFIINFM